MSVEFSVSDFSLSVNVNKTIEINRSNFFAKTQTLTLTLTVNRPFLTCNVYNFLWHWFHLYFEEFFLGNQHHFSFYQRLDPPSVLNGHKCCTHAWKLKKKKNDIGFHFIPMNFKIAKIHIKIKDGSKLEHLQYFHPSKLFTSVTCYILSKFLTQDMNQCLNKIIVSNYFIHTQ